MVQLDALHNLDIGAWTALLTQAPGMKGLGVTAVETVASANKQQKLYRLYLEDHPESITLIGHRTSAAEAHFYKTVGRYLPDLVPYCWFSHANGNESWLLTDPIYDDHTLQHWDAQDVEKVINDLAAFHATFWQRHKFLTRNGWTSFLSSKNNTLPGDQSPAQTKQPDQTELSDWQPQRFISPHAINSAGRLAPVLLQAAEGLEIMKSVGGWPGVIDDRHLRAVADLLDDPVPMLQPLREQPMTLLHGNPAPYNWHLTLFDQRHLTGWEQVSAGPAVYDLVKFIAQFDLISNGDAGWQHRSRPIALEETIVDSYILALGHHLNHDFNARATREAIPAGKCLHVVTTWFPRFAGWFRHGTPDRQEWHNLNRMNDDELAEAGFTSMVGLRPYLVRLFEHFLDAYQQL